jgi:hypothetical protein
VNNDDTLINSNTYTQVFECGGSYKGAFREVGREVWYVPGDSTNEYLIYDFDVIPGEILSNVYFEQGGFSPMLQDLTVAYVTTVQINGVDHVAVEMEFGGFLWIEGIGCTSGFLCEPWQNISQYQVKLECMSLSTVTLYPNYGSGTCPFDLGFTEALTSYQIAPNPVVNELFVHGDVHGKDLKLFDPFGREQSIFKLPTEEGLTIDVSGLSSGIYLLGTSPQNGQKVIKL